MGHLGKVGWFWLKFSSIVMMSTIPLGSILSLNMGEAWLKEAKTATAEGAGETGIKSNNNAKDTKNNEY